MKLLILLHQKNIPVLIDGTQGAPHLKLDMQKLDCDFYVIFVSNCTDLMV